jgi:hypothetical protein
LDHHVLTLSNSRFDLSCSKLSKLCCLPNILQQCNLLFKIDFIADNGAVVWNNDEDWPFFKIDDYIDPVSNQWRMEVNIEVALPTSG